MHFSCFVKGLETFYNSKFICKSRPFNSMGSSAQASKRPFVKILLRIAALYRFVCNVNRDSSDAELNTAFRKVALYVDGAGQRPLTISSGHSLKNSQAFGPCSTSSQMRLNAICISHVSLKGSRHFTIRGSFANLALSVRWGLRHRPPNEHSSRYCSALRRFTGLSAMSTGTLAMPSSTQHSGRSRYT